MFKTGLVFFAALIFAVGCTSPNKNSWGSKPGAQRSVASINDFVQADDAETRTAITALDTALFANGNLTVTKGRLESRMVQILKRSAAGYTLLKEFDAKLTAWDNAGTKNYNIQNEAVYKKLMVTRSLLEAVEKRFVSIYAHLWKVSLGVAPGMIGPSGPIPNFGRTQGRAQDVLKALHDKIALFGSDAKVLGFFRMKQQLEDVFDSLESDMPATTQSNKDMHTALGKLISDITAREATLASVTNYDEFIKIMDEDPELKNVLKDIKDGADPAGPQQLLPSPFKNINGSNMNDNEWVLTFDDGPHKDNTRLIATVLKDNGDIKAMFFWLSNNVSTFQTISDEILDAGHIVASHSVDHANLPKLTTAKITTQVSGSRDIIEKVLTDKGNTYDMGYFRAPYGAGVLPPKSQKVIDGIVAAGLTHIAWNVDSMDWQDKNSDSVVERVIKQMKAQGGGVILFHDIQNTTANGSVSKLLKSKYVKDSGSKFDPSYLK